MFDFFSTLSELILTIVPIIGAGLYFSAPMRKRWHEKNQKHRAFINARTDYLSPEFQKIISPKYDGIKIPKGVETIVPSERPALYSRNAMYIKTFRHELIEFLSVCQSPTSPEKRTLAQTKLRSLVWALKEKKKNLLDEFNIYRTSTERYLKPPEVVHLYYLIDDIVNLYETQPLIAIQQFMTRKPTPHEGIDSSLNPLPSAEDFFIHVLFTTQRYELYDSAKPSV